LQFPKKSSEYNSLIELQGSWAPVYGPINSRRLGRSLGINLLGDEKKLCSYDCVYCDLGLTQIRMNDLKKTGTFRGKESLIPEIRNRFSELSSKNEKVDAISIVGNGEPTLHPEFDDLTQAIKQARDEYFANVPIAIFTNGANLDQRKVQAGLKHIDIKMVKLDAGNDRTMKGINRPLVKESAESIISGARKVSGIILQSLFVQGSTDNTKNEDIEDWIEAVGMIKPDLVHIYSIDRVPAESGLIKPEEDTLYTIAAKLEKRTRIKWKVFY
jgi:wyosine [tRNA(Phe)-imidazoG37] synthetase (radical SAM superfamily)